VTRSPITHTRAALLLDYECDNACVFCGQAGVELEGRTLGDPREALVELRARHDEISFVGGEPALDPRLPELIAFARELEFSAIGLQTNGRRLAQGDGLFDELVGAGLDAIHVSIHGASSDAHDYHTGRAGSLAALLDLMGRAQRAAVTIVATTVITRSNFRELPKLPPALKRRGVSAWLLEPVRAYGRAADGFARVVPRFGMALPWALHGLEQARRNDLSAWIRGAPLCALGPFAASALPDAPATAGAEGLKIYPEPCTSCPARPRCPGVDRVYLDVFGSKELIAREARQLAPFDEGRARLIRMFVGVGTLMPREPQLYSPPATEDADAQPSASKNLRLPVLPSEPDSESG
jgi:hypothetical protein